MTKEKGKSSIYLEIEKGDMNRSKKIVIEIKDENSEKVLKQFDEVMKRTKVLEEGI